ncbi:hypothetical protein CMUS01_00069 [Colletotrichum musicola]|uniref:Uncharacterized protein n=1 Tax=Colletotrichum musicola TaxID=2175873 RepID=A0A8H6NZM8_9PEZI|nr:hypothetical protein CMUS01_00069 [Colletotrichum musicola]
MIPLVSTRSTTTTTTYSPESTTNHRGRRSVRRLFGGSPPTLFRPSALPPRPPLRLSSQASSSKRPCDWLGPMPVETKPMCPPVCLASVKDSKYFEYFEHQGPGACIESYNLLTAESRGVLFFPPPTPTTVPALPPGWECWWCNRANTRIVVFLANRSWLVGHPPHPISFDAPARSPPAWPISRRRIAEPEPQPWRRGPSSSRTFPFTAVSSWFCTSSGHLRTGPARFDCFAMEAKTEGATTFLMLGTQIPLAADVFILCQPGVADLFRIDPESLAGGLRGWWLRGSKPSSLPPRGNGDQGEKSHTG